MDIALYLGGILVALLLTLYAARRWGRMPSRKEIALAGIGALLLMMVYLAFIVILMSEGNGERLPLILLACVWVVLACVQPLGRAFACSVGLLALCVVLKFVHLGLALLPHYTDSPQARHRSVKIYNISAGRQGKPLRPEVVIRPTWYTWLTGLYSVKPFEGSNHTD